MNTAGKLKANQKTKDAKLVILSNYLKCVCFLNLTIVIKV